MHDSEKHVNKLHVLTGGFVLSDSSVPGRPFSSPPPPPPSVKQWPHITYEESTDCLKYLPLFSSGLFFPISPQHREQGGDEKPERPWRETSDPPAKWELVSFSRTLELVSISKSLKFNQWKKLGSKFPVEFRHCYLCISHQRLRQRKKALLIAAALTSFSAFHCSACEVSEQNKSG